MKNLITVTPNMSMSKIQSCLKEMGCTIKFAKGTYNITQTLRLFSNTKIILDGVTLVRKFNGAVFMTYVSNKTVGYTGRHDIEIVGGTIIANGSKKISNIINIVHAKNVVIKGLTIKNNVGSHAIEVNGSKNVTIENCVFDGNIVDKKNAYRECIQIDMSHFKGLNYTNNKSDKTYDLTHCSNITIRNCVFKGYNVAIGTHTQAKSKSKHVNINIIGNHFTGVGAIGGYGSAINIMNFQNVLIKDNVITGFARGVEITSSNRFYSGNGTITYTKPNYVIGSKDIEIMGNTISKPSKDYKASGIYITSKFDDLMHDNILIKNNVFELKNEVSQYDVYYKNATNVIQKDNRRVV